MHYNGAYYGQRLDEQCWYQQFRYSRCGRASGPQPQTPDCRAFHSGPAEHHREIL